MLPYRACRTWVPCRTRYLLEDLVQACAGEALLVVVQQHVVGGKRGVDQPAGEGGVGRGGSGRERWRAQNHNRYA